MTRPTRREIEREVDDLRSDVPTEEQLQRDLTVEEKEFLDETFDVDPNGETPAWQQERLDALFAMSGVDA